MIKTDRAVAIVTEDESMGRRPGGLQLVRVDQPLFHFTADMTGYGNRFFFHSNFRHNFRNVDDRTWGPLSGYENQGGNVKEGQQDKG